MGKTRNQHARKRLKWTKGIGRQEVVLITIHGHRRRGRGQNTGQGRYWYKTINQPKLKTNQRGYSLNSTSSSHLKLSCCCCCCWSLGVMLIICCDRVHDVKEHIHGFFCWCNKACKHHISLLHGWLFNRNHWETLGKWKDSRLGWTECHIIETLFCC